MIDKQTEDQIRKIVREILDIEPRVIHQTDIPSETIKQRHIELGAMVVFRGLAADRPDGTGEVKAYFATDTAVLSIYDGSAWVDFPRIPAAPATYAASNVNEDRTYDADTAVVAETNDVLGTLIADLRAIGLVD